MLGSVLGIAHLGAAVLSVLMVGAVAAALQRSLALAIGVVLVGLIASNSSMPGLKEPFLTARWAALAALAAFLVPEAVRHSRGLLVPVVCLAPLPLLGVVSAAWSV